MPRIVLYLLPFVILLPWPRAAAARQGAADFRRLEGAVAAALKETKVPGAAVAVVSGDRVVFSKGFGVADVETGRAVTPEGEPPQLPFLPIPGADGRVEYLHTNARAFRRVSD